MKKKAKSPGKEAIAVEPIVLGEGTDNERVFRPSVPTTFEQDLFLMDLLDETGVGGIVDDIDPMTMELNEVGMRIIRMAYRSGKLFLLLGAILSEEGVVFSEDVAHANAEYFAGLTSPVDKERLHGPVASVVLSFFMSALASSETSQKSLSRSELKELLTSAAENLEDGQGNVDAPLIVDVMTTANGKLQSAK